MLEMSKILCVNVHIIDIHSECIQNYINAAILLYYHSILLQDIAIQIFHVKVIVMPEEPKGVTS